MGCVPFRPARWVPDYWLSGCTGRSRCATIHGSGVLRGRPGTGSSDPAVRRARWCFWQLFLRFRGQRKIRRPPERFSINSAKATTARTGAMPRSNASAWTARPAISNTTARTNRINASFFMNRAAFPICRAGTSLVRDSRSGLSDMARGHGISGCGARSRFHSLRRSQLLEHRPRRQGPSPTSGSGRPRGRGAVRAQRDT